MTIIKEYRITLPITVEEYQVAQLYSVAESSKNETGGGEGVEVLKNEPYAEGSEGTKKSIGRPGQYTHKLFHLESRVPAFIKMIAPKGSLTIDEKAWNAYPYCRTVISNPDYMKDNMEIELLTWHKPDDGRIENVHKLDEKTWKNVEVVRIDIAADPIQSNDYKKENDPLTYRHEKSDRGPLKKTWLMDLRRMCDNIINARKHNLPPSDQNVITHMTCYKLVSAKFKWFGLQSRVEKFIHNAERRIFFLFHRQVYTWMDGWYGKTMADIRELEAAAKRDLDEKRGQGEKKGHELGKE